MPPVELDSPAPTPRQDVHGLLFRFDDFTYAPALRSLFAIDPVMDDKPFYIAPGKDRAQLDLFERLPEIDLPPHVHKPAWGALEAMMRSLMADETLRALVRGETTHGPVSFGYHASEPYAVVESAIAERVAVVRLRDLRDAARSAVRQLSPADRAESIGRELERLSFGEHAEVRRWALGERSFDPAWAAFAGFAAALARSIARTLDGYGAVDHRVAEWLAERENVVHWIGSLSHGPLFDSFEPVLSMVRARGTLTDDELFAQCLLATGGVEESGSWWWTLGRLGDHDRVASVFAASKTPVDLVAAMARFAKQAKATVPSILEHARAVGSTNDAWRAMVRNVLG
ncbi:MAG: hypothetical protein JNK05_13900 [Myxococcales bacterium]|nr:hypothetical protein [Myxococcales bacterium]